MPDMNAAPTNELPSAGKLLRSTLIALAVAVVLLVTVVLPAEYGVDPTRIGRALGLTQMGEIKVSLAREAAAEDSLEAAGLTVPASGAASSAGLSRSDVPPSAPIAAAATPVTTSHVTEVVLRPNEGAEVKLVMRKDARVRYSWSVDRGAVNYDIHADAPGIRYHGYGKGSGKPSDEGELVAAFDGSHGWFWRNRGREVVTVTLRTDGAYTELKRM